MTPGLLARLHALRVAYLAVAAAGTVWLLADGQRAAAAAVGGLAAVEGAVWLARWRGARRAAAAPGTRHMGAGGLVVELPPGFRVAADAAAGLTLEGPGVVVAVSLIAGARPGDGVAERARAACLEALGPPEPTGLRPAAARLGDLEATGVVGAVATAFEAAEVRVVAAHAPAGVLVASTFREVGVPAALVDRVLAGVRVEGGSG